MNQNPNLCPVCGSVDAHLSSRFCPHHIEQLRRLIRARAARRAVTVAA